jgi:hypothetical protein
VTITESTDIPRIIIDGLNVRLEQPVRASQAIEINPFENVKER